MSPINSVREYKNKKAAEIRQMQDEILNKAEKEKADIEQKLQEKKNEIRIKIDEEQNRLDERAQAKNKSRNPVTKLREHRNEKKHVKEFAKDRKADEKEKKSLEEELKRKEEEILKIKRGLNSNTEKARILLKTFKKNENTDNTDETSVTPLIETNTSNNTETEKAEITELVGSSNTESDAADINEEKINNEYSVNEETFRFTEETSGQKEHKYNSIKTKSGIFLIICTVIFAALTLFDCYMELNTMAFVSLIQTGLFIIALLLKAHVIKEKSKKIHKILTIIALLLIIPHLLLLVIVSQLFNSFTVHNEKLDWNTIVLSDKLPEPESDRGKVLLNSDKELYVYVAHTSQRKYNSYKQQCEEFGYTIDAEDNGSRYRAYDKEGYKLLLSFDDDDREFSIELNTPINKTELVWPTYGLAEALPVPKSKTGIIKSNSDAEFIVYVSNTSKADYDEYTNKCLNSGFNIEYDKSENLYYGNNSSGLHASVSFEGNNTMLIDIIDMGTDSLAVQPQKEVTTETTTIVATATQPTTQKPTTTVTVAPTQPATKPAPPPATSAPATSAPPPAAPAPPPVAQQKAAATATQERNVMAYVLNTNTMKFHYPSCSSVKKMSAANKKNFEGTRAEVIAMGYSPCGRCNP